MADMVESAFEWLTAVTKHADHDQKSHGRRGVASFRHTPAAAADLEDRIDAIVDGQEVGHLEWYADDGEIFMVHVEPEFRRQGLASKMLAEARKITPNIHHSKTLSAAGRAWASVTKHGRKGEPGYHLLHPNSRGGGISWRPTMTRIEAEEWAKDSAIKAPLTFIGKRRSTAKIKEEGFQNIEILSPQEARERLNQQQEAWDAWFNAKQAARAAKQQEQWEELEDIDRREEAGEIDSDTADAMSDVLYNEVTSFMSEWEKANPEPSLDNWRGKVRAGRVWGDGIYLGMADIKANKIWDEEFGEKRAKWETARAEATADFYDAEFKAKQVMDEKIRDLEYMDIPFSRQDELRAEIEKPYFTARAERRAAEARWKEANPAPKEPVELVDPSINMYGPMKTVYPELDHDAYEAAMAEFRRKSDEFAASIRHLNESERFDAVNAWNAANPWPNKDDFRSEFAYGQALLVKVNVTNPAVINVPDNDPTYNTPEEHIAQQVPGFGDLFADHSADGLVREQAMSRALIDLGYDALVVTQYRPGEEEQGQRFDNGAGGPQVVLFDRTKAVVVSDESPRYMDEIYKRLMEVRKHDGPGSHDNGTPQKVHGGGGTKLKKRPSAFSAVIRNIVRDYPDVLDADIVAVANQLLNGNDPSHVDTLDDYGRDLWERNVREALVQTGVVQRRPRVFSNSRGDTATVNPDGSITETFANGGTGTTPAAYAATRLAALEDPSSAWVEVDQDSGEEPTAYNAALARIILDYPEINDNRLRRTAERLLHGSEAHVLNALSDEGIRIWENSLRRELGLSQRTRPLPPSSVAPSRTMPTPPPSRTQSQTRLMEAIRSSFPLTEDDAYDAVDRAITNLSFRWRTEEMTTDEEVRVFSTATTHAREIANRRANELAEQMAAASVVDAEQKVLPMKGLPEPPPPAPPVAPSLRGSEISDWLTTPQDKIPELEDHKRRFEDELEVELDPDTSDADYQPDPDNVAFLRARIQEIEDEISDLEYAENELKPEVEAAIRDTYMVKAGGLRSEVTSISADSYEVRVAGKVYDEASGAQAGTFTRVFTDDPYSGGIVVTHDYFMIESQYRAQKFGDAFFKKSIDVYQDNSGITKLKVHANIDIGGYVWARRGFEWDTEESYGGIPAKAQRYLAKAVVGADALNDEVKIYRESRSYGETMVVLPDGTGYIIDSTYGDPSITRWFDEPYEVLEHLDGVTLDPDEWEVYENSDATRVYVNESSATLYRQYEGAGLTYKDFSLKDTLLDPDNGFKKLDNPDLPEWIPSDSWTEMNAEAREDLHPDRPLHEWTVDQAREWIKADVQQDYDIMPTPNDLAMWGADRPENRWDKPITTPSGKSAKSVPMWPGKEMMLGTDWYGVIELGGW